MRASPAGDQVTLAGFTERPRRVRLLGSKAKLRWRSETAGLAVALPKGRDTEQPAYTIAFER